MTSFYTIDALIAGQWATAGDAFAHLVLPVVTLALAPLAFLVRLLRANLLDISRENFIVVVRSKGLGRWPAFTRHALPNAFLPTLTASGLLLAQLLTGAVLVEKVFNWPGRRRPRGRLDPAPGLRGGADVHPPERLLLRRRSTCVIDVLYGVIDPRVRVPRGWRMTRDLRARGDRPRDAFPHEGGHRRARCAPSRSRSSAARPSPSSASRAAGKSTLGALDPRPDRAARPHRGRQRGAQRPRHLQAVRPRDAEGARQGGVADLPGRR